MTVSVANPIKLLGSINGGAYTSGELIGSFNGTLDLKVQDTSGLSSIVYEIYSYPTAFTLPTGWSQDPASGYYFYAPANVTIAPPRVTFPATGQSSWGYYMLRVRGNTNPLRLGTNGVPNTSYSPWLTDEATVVDILSPVKGMKGIAFGLSTQADPMRAYAGPLMQSLGAVDAGGGGGGGAGSTTTAGTFTQPAAGALITHDGSGNPISGVPLTDPTIATVGKGLTLAGAGFYNCEGLSGSTATLRNGTSAVNAAPGSIFAAGVVVTPGGQGAPQSGTAALGQGLALLGTGTYKPYQLIPLLFTDLSTKAPDNTRQSVTIDGYASPGDGGGGTFYWVAGTFTSDGGTIVVPTGFATIGAWVRQIHNGIYSIRFFGAKGDATNSQTGTDDTLAIRACVAAICLNGSAGATLYFPANPAQTTATIYRTTGPIFTAGSSMPITADGGTTMAMDRTIPGPAFWTGAQLPQITTGTESGLTYETSPFYNMMYYPNANSLSGWGNGNLTQTTATFVIPATLGVVASIAVSNALAIGIVGSNNIGYWQGVGICQATVIDATHVSLFFLGQALPTDATSGSTAPIGTAIGNQNAGFTFECYVDPIVAWPVGSNNAYLFVSQGGVGSVTPTSAVQVYLYNDQGTAQTRLRFKLTTTSGAFTLSSGASLVTPGTMVHVAAVYDGVGTAALYIAGVRVATASVTGTLVQNWYESVLVGSNNGSGNFPGVSGDGPVTFRQASPAWTALGKYKGTSFTPPTATITVIPRINTNVLDYSSVPTAIGPGGLDFGHGFILATTANLALSQTGLATWIPSSTAINTNFLSFVGFPRFRHMGITSGGSGIWAVASLYGGTEDCSITSAYQCVILDGYSYNNRFYNNQFQAQAAYTSGLGCCLAVLAGSQYTIANGGQYIGGTWNIINNVFAGIMIENLWLEATGFGAILLSSSGGPSASLRNCFIQDDAGRLLSPIAGVYASGIIHFTWTGGYCGLSAPCHVLVVDSVTSGHVIGVGMYPNAGPAGYPETIYFINQTTPFRVSSAQPQSPFVYASVFTQYHVTHGSANVVASSTAYATATVPNQYIQFASQPNTTYKIATSDPVTGNFTIAPAYSGTTSTATQATKTGTPWMPETGASGQGPLVIDSQTDFGLNVVNMVSASGMTLFINDALQGLTKITDVDGLLAGTEQITLPLIAGYRLSFINATTKTLTFGGATGAVVAIAPSASANIACDGTGWLQAA